MAKRYWVRHTILDWVRVAGRRITIFGFDCVIHRPVNEHGECEDEGWRISELESGYGIMGQYITETQDEAIDSATEMIRLHGREDVERRIAEKSQWSIFTTGASK